jgi:pilus assembly protein CpaB
MRRTQVLILLFALGCAVLAAMLVSGLIGQRAPAPTAEAPPPPVTSASVLVAAKDLATGERLNALSFEWRDWPIGNVASFMITREARPDAIRELEGSRARAQMFLGEPISERKVVTLKDGGLMSSLLPKGLRGIAVRISDRTAVAGFILPNDRVDVISTLRVNFEGSGADRVVVFTRTIMTNVKVLAVNRTISPDTDLPSISDLQTAVLELEPEQAEILALAEAQGEITLALRSNQEMASNDPASQLPQFADAAVSGNGVSVFSPSGQADFDCEGDCLPTARGLNSPFPLTFRDEVEKKPSSVNK